jgi:hypothetical protein
MDQLPPLSAPELPHEPDLERAPRQPALGQIESACAIALHMHQPLIPAGGDELSQARIISNLEYMRERGSDSERHDAQMFHQCYRRMGELVRTLVDAGQSPRVMLEYSGTLLHGLTQMGLTDVFDELRRVTVPGAYRHAVEWLGAPWGHAVAPSTPSLDYRRHVRAWQAHFADLFGAEALARVRGFSPSEMALPNHPEHAYELVRTLREAGYEWMLVQEHSVELGGTGSRPSQMHVPHRLVCHSSRGDSASIVAIIKTRGSDSKLVGQMQPYYEARSLRRVALAGVAVPQLVTQIADGENGGVMMNEFPSKYVEVVGLASNSGTPLLNVSEYLDELYALGVRPEHLPELWPATQSRIWQRVKPGDGPERLAQAIAELSADDPRFHLEGGSWTNDISWVRGYGALLDDMQRVSALFHEKVDRAGVSPHEQRSRNALFHLLCSQTSCYRYWGEGRWTDYGRELCRRTLDILTHDF